MTTYNHPQLDLARCAECGTLPSLTKGDKHYYLFCPTPTCFNLGVDGADLQALKRDWDAGQEKGKQ